ncbi:MAG: translation initiation factor IF-2 [Ktedonobacteraceae bacterium]|nr:translation initiation factor IF-2 [Ktedonobacteraceae bacterium]MBV9710623.1 translation initiation factor IF-2 [Ktedonobacteraceae bacterium]
MRDTSEFPDATEQAKPAATRAKTSTRSKATNAQSGSQEQNTRPPTRRRTAQSQPAATAHIQNGSDDTATTSPIVSPSSQPAGAHDANAAPPQRSAGQRPTRNGGQSATPRTGGTVQQRPGNAPTQQRNTATPTQQRNSAAPAQQQRNNTAYQSGTRPAPSYRQGGTGQQTPAQRQGHPSQRPGGTSTTGTQQVQRSGVRPGNQTTPGHRPQGQGRPGGGARPAGRSTTPAQKTHERRAPVVKEKPTGPISLPPQIMVKDLAELLSVTPNEAIRGLIKHGVFANINQIVEYDKASLVAQDIGFEPTLSTATDTSSAQGERRLSANEAMMAARNDNDTVVIPPVVTIMGHVDHGKTSLLDTIRKTKVAAGEAGGITQHIGAYQVETHGKKITFLDTPGHEAFTAMRARGAQGAHIAIIVVAADDGVMPQTREAIDHARAAKVPIIIALNKIDKANANPDHVKQQLAEIDVVIEEYGGDIVCVPVSARKGIGIDDLLDYILLVAEVQDIRANPNRLASGVIVEARLEKNSGPTATVLVQQGTLKMGDNIVVGPIAGKVRAMFNDRGKRIQKAPPSTPVSIIGLSEVPQAGDRLEAVSDERTAKQRAQQETEKRRNENGSIGQVSLDTLYSQMQEGKVKELELILKCDVQGSSEAIKNALTKVGEENFNKVRLIHEGIGNISETDVHLAAASGAIIIGFNVKADGAALREAQKDGVDIRYYNVIYKLTDDIQAALVGMLEPTLREVIDGHAEVMQIFKAGKNVVIAGCRITDGKLTRTSHARVMRKETQVHEGKIASLRRGKDDVREVASGYECGIVLEDFTDFEVGDIIEAFSQEKVKPGA